LQSELVMRASFFCLLPPVVIACSSSTVYTSGPNGKLDFDFSTQALDCQDGCPIDRAIMQGSSEVISVQATKRTCGKEYCGGSIPPVTVTSSRSDVVAIAKATRSCFQPDTTDGQQTIDLGGTCPDGDFTDLSLALDALAPGSSTLTFTGTDGTVYDTITLNVAAPNELDLLCDPLHVDPTTKSSGLQPSETGPLPTTMQLGSACSFAWRARDAAGNSLIASNGVSVSSSSAIIGFESVGELSLQVAPQPAVAADQTSAGDTMIVASGTGDATITAQTGSVTVSASIHVM
jgi:hypothetical protein